MKKRILLLATLISTIFTCSACEEKNSLEGLWKNDSGESLLFSDSGTVLVNNEISGTYEIVDEDILLCKFDVLVDFSVSAKFSVKNEELTLTDLENGETSVYYGYEKQQQEQHKQQEQQEQPYPVIESVAEEFTPEDYEKAETVFVEEVLPVWIDNLPETISVTYMYDGAITIDGAFYYTFTLYEDFEDRIYPICFFAITPDGEEVLWGDESTSRYEIFTGEYPTYD